MGTEAKLRRVHKLATLIIGVQLLVWTVTGFAFSWTDFTKVSGSVERAAEAALDLSGLQLTPAQAVAKAVATDSKARVTLVELRGLLGSPTYAVHVDPGGVVLVDGVTGNLQPPVSAETAARIARSAHRDPVEVLAVETVSDPKDAPFLIPPLFRVRLGDSARTEVFVSPKTGEIEAWRNQAWRRFDWLWSLHTMGYVSRENPAHWGLRITAALALIAVLSGTVLLVRSAPRKRRISIPATEGRLFESPVREI